MKLSLAPYSDIIPILDAALSAGGAQFACASPGAATRWIARANMARKIDRELRAETRRPGEPLESKWDGLRIAKPSKESDRVVISAREAVTQVFDLDGNPLDLSKALEEVDPLEEFARNLAGKQ